MESEHVWRVGACNRSPSLNNDNNIFNGIMLRFRPIAPKPVTGEQTPANQSTTASLPGKRTKRKYVRIRRNNGYIKKNSCKKSSPEEEIVVQHSNSNDEMKRNLAVVTLQLMPEKAAATSNVDLNLNLNLNLNLTVENIQILDNLNRSQNNPDLETMNAGKFLDLLPAVEKAVVESWITVESVTGMCMVVEKVKNIETDTCPCFITDGNGKVLRVNDAYKKMVVNDESEEVEVVIWLKVKQSVAWCYSYPAFTCGVRLQYTWRNEKCLKMVPCDVWRLECGGFAWRLDVKAALSLGL